MSVSGERSEEITEAVPAVESVSGRGPLGIWATFAVSLGIWAASFCVDIMMILIVTLVEAVNNPAFDALAFAKRPDMQGLLMSLATCVTMPLCTAVVVLIVRLRVGPSVLPRLHSLSACEDSSAEPASTQVQVLPVSVEPSPPARGLHADPERPMRSLVAAPSRSVKDYLAIRAVSLSGLLGWVGITLLLGLASTAVSYALDQPISEFIIMAYDGAYFYPVLWIGLVVCAPVYEEVFFRGFMYEGIAQSKLGPAGAVVLTSVVWSGIHLQYGYFELCLLVVFGIVLGIARLRTRSILPCIAMHSAFNVLAALEAVIALGVGARCR